jgi:hypothetical protein
MAEEVNLVLEQEKKNLYEVIQENNAIIEGLENNEPFKNLIEKFKKTAKQLDDNWQWITDEKALLQAQITKMAQLSIIHALDNLRHDSKLAQDRIIKIENPEEVTTADYDGE